MSPIHSLVWQCLDFTSMQMLSTLLKRERERSAQTQTHVGNNFSYSIYIYNSTHLLPVSLITSQMRLNGRQLDKLTFLSLFPSLIRLLFYFNIFFLHPIVSAIDAWSLRPRFFFLFFSLSLSPWSLITNNLARKNRQVLHDVALSISILKFLVSTLLFRVTSYSNF